MAHDILLETGTNEVEFLEFYVSGQSFGINVAKVKQLIRFEGHLLTRLPQSFDSVIGSLLHQNRNIPIIDLSRHLKKEPIEQNDQQIVVITDFNNSVTGFLVDGVNKIHRLTWEQLQSVSSALQHLNPKMTGVVVLDDKEVLILDFEYILDDVQPDRVLHKLQKLEDAPKTAARPHKRGERVVFFAEDSKLFRECLVNLLRGAGYTDLTVFENGLNLYKAARRLAQRAKQEGNKLSDHIHLILSDIEMPQMDGLTLCREIKQIAGNLPVIILSSLITDQVSLKCRSVGADANLSKKELHKLLRTMDEMALGGK